MTLLIPAHACARRLAVAGLLLVTLLILPAAGQARRKSPLPGQINTILKQSPARRGFWGVVVVHLPDGKHLYSRHGAHLFQPASNLKLLTTAAALEKIGPDFTCLTTVESASPPDSAGRVGDVYIVGRGDANFASSRVLPYQGSATQRNTHASLVAISDLADQVAAHGVREVTGNLIADDSYFVDEPYPPDWAVDDMVWGYGAPVTALVFNDNTLLLRIEPARTTGVKAHVRLEPVEDYYKVVNSVVTVAAGTPAALRVDRQPGSMELDVWGSIPVGSPPSEMTVAIQNPSLLVADLLRRDLEARGIKVRCDVKVHHRLRQDADEADKTPSTSSARVVLAEHRSLPLREDVKLTDKVSQNLHAEMLLRTMGQELEHTGSRKAGLKVLGQFMNAAGITPNEMRIADGSGLSRDDLVSPEAIAKLLEYMARSPRFEDFYSALPVAGVDGTLADRFKGTPAEGRIHAKTGSIKHVDSLSGYMDLPNGDRLAFSIIGNADPLKPREAEEITDRIALAIFKQYSRRQRHWR